MEYYCQRGDFGLIITEATSVSKRGHSWPGSLKFKISKFIKIFFKKNRAACLYNEA